ncbi:ABC-three component system middle component 6 [Methanosarcina sp. DH1]|uniref:ABC-three component system middle component 6 n=1 Tax=Methanosarcina sp. DH1 TaxID=2605695 RepID=UPI001E60A544|nr:ABC-three component system middle component 6 [Methanosarcina sp. DH1]
MIAPTKNKTFRYSILGASSKIIPELKTPHTVSSLWEKVRILEEISSFGKYILLLDFLYMVGLINLDMGLITLNTPSKNLLESDSFKFTIFETKFSELKIFTNFSEFCEELSNDFTE